MLTLCRDEYRISYHLNGSCFMCSNKAIIKHCCVVWKRYFPLYPSNYHQLTDLSENSVFFLLLLLSIIHRTVALSVYCTLRYVLSSKKSISSYRKVTWNHFFQTNVRRDFVLGRIAESSEQTKRRPFYEVFFFAITKCKYIEMGKKIILIWKFMGSTYCRTLWRDSQSFYCIDWNDIILTIGENVKIIASVQENRKTHIRPRPCVIWLLSE